ncbi:glutaminyl-peptide cyclotransferase [Salinisphaera sp. T31B1]|uniref:glutaminyl-peptide cyclotransferase n=1 Tax=Salinisphaera sp. T31B1 TaxID=727963 RepID=UPI00333ED609
MPLLLAAIALWAVAGCAEPVAQERARILASYPHDPGAFTQGLLIHDGKLFESTGQYGQSTLRRVDIDSGRVERSVALPETFFGEGLALVGDRLYQLTWKQGVVLVYDRASLREVQRMHYEGQGWGLTWDGQDLIMSDGTATLRRIDPNGFRVIGRLTVRDNGTPVERLNELEYIDGEIWANVWYENRILRIDPDTGRVVARLDASPLVSALPPDGRPNVLNGIAWDAEADRLYLTGKYWSRLFEVARPNTAAAAPGQTTP